MVRQLHGVRLSCVQYAPIPKHFLHSYACRELVAEVWTNAAIADELSKKSGYVSRTRVVLIRALVDEDTIAAIRRLRFPCEFRAGIGRAFIDTPRVIWLRENMQQPGLLNSWNTCSK